MPIRFTVLASGSAGNASLLQAGDFGVLIDAGLGPRQLAGRLAAVGLSWSAIQAVLLTHTHSDHWHERTLAHLRRRRLPVYCHPAHHEPLLTNGSEFGLLRADDLIRPYADGEEFPLAPALRCRPLPLRHDGGPTFGFRFEGSTEFPGGPWALAYVADLGSWTRELAQALSDVDILALEFNHDVHLERTSGRSPYLIARVLGDDGHLSNDQAGGLLREILALSAPGRVQHVVQLHLSRDCNHPTLAAETARAVLAEYATGVALHTTSQHEPSPTIMPEGPACLPRAARKRPVRAKGTRTVRVSSPSQPWLPGLET
jgi:phosphoribosyl 1,2-cyclic phosphodiesterase